MKHPSSRYSCYPYSQHCDSAHGSALQFAWTIYACSSNSTIVTDPSGWYGQPEHIAWDAMIHEVNVSPKHWLEHAPG